MKVIKAEWTNADALDSQPDSISRQAAIEKTEMLYRDAGDDASYMLIGYNHALSDIRAILKSLPSAQPEPTGDAEFWRKRADFYSDMCMNLIGEMEKGVKIKSVKISENGIEFIKEQPSAQPDYDLSGYSDRLWQAAYERGKAESRKKGKWIWQGSISEGCWVCSECKNKFYQGYGNENFCPNCGADMREEAEDGT